jgi:alpha-glucosidase
VNVEAEQADPQSLLHWYEKLIELRRSRPALFTGAQVLLDRDAQNALVWVRKTPAGSPQSAPIVVACNLSAQPVTLQLHKDIVKLGLRGTFLRTLMRSDNGMGPVNLDAVTLQPFGVYIGELGR